MSRKNFFFLRFGRWILRGPRQKRVLRKGHVGSTSARGSEQTRPRSNLRSTTAVRGVNGGGLQRRVDETGT